VHQAALSGIISFLERRVDRPVAPNGHKIGSSVSGGVVRGVAFIAVGDFGRVAVFAIGMGVGV